jgi:hypothetical protein
MYVLICVNDCVYICDGALHYQVEIAALTPASTTDMVSLMGPPKPQGGPTTMFPRDYVLKFAEEGPLGIQLDIFKYDQSLLFAC